MLDESAIEAMIARQRQVMDRDHEPAPTVRTVQTDEFEVYERKPDPEPAAAPTPPAPPAPAAAPPREDEEYEVFERAPPAPAEPPQEAEPAPPLPEEPAPEPEPSPATPPARPFTPQPTRRPEVWPPIGARTAQTAQPAHAAPPAPTTASTSAPPVTPRSHAPRPSHDATAPAPESTPAPTAHAFPDLSTTAPADGSTPRIAIVQALFNEEITNDMANLARQKADKLGAPVVQHLRVPGVYDLPLAVQALLRRDDVDCVVALGCVVTGQTKHDEVITHATAKSLQEVSLATGKPVGFGVIGPGMTWKQAEARVVNGKHAVEAAVAQWHLLRSLTA